jgi:hypothetical protein
MKLIYGLIMALNCGIAIAAERPMFYVLDVRHTGEAVLHANNDKIPKTDQPYILVDTNKINCCFRFGIKPGTGKSTIKIDEDAPPLTSSKGEEIYQLPGYITATSTGAKKSGEDTLAFGLPGMRAVSVKAKGTYEVTVEGQEKPVIIRQCLGAEGVNFRLYHTLTEKKPYVTYYFALGYDTKADCK